MAGCAQPLPGEGVVAPLPYQACDVPSRLIVPAPGPQGKREKPGRVVPTEVTICNGRAKELTLDRHGFTLTEFPVIPGDYYDSSWVIRELYPACCHLVKQQTGATRVFAYNHILRSKAQSEGSRRLSSCERRVEAPFQFVHNDISGPTARQRVREFGLPPRRGDALRALLGQEPLIDPAEMPEVLQGRWAFITCWRNFKETPVQKLPLALCDASSIRKDDLVTLEMRHEGRSGEFLIAKHSAEHRWIYFPGLTCDEAILLKLWDSAGSTPLAGDEELCSHGLHSAFEDPSSPADAEDRESIEVRMVAFFSRPEQT